MLSRCERREQVDFKLRYIITEIGLGLEPKKNIKNRACPARVAEAGQENI
jgi:hypothetical protein